MKICVFTCHSRPPMSASLMPSSSITVTQWKVLTWPDFSLWTDEDDTEDTEAALRQFYLEPNGISAEQIGRIGARFWWVRVAEPTTDFYSEGDAEAADALAWRTLYTFTNCLSSDDCISKEFDYIPSDDIKAAMRAGWPHRT
jgi:hypothetical protein